MNHIACFDGRTKKVFEFLDVSDEITVRDLREYLDRKYINYKLINCGISISTEINDLKLKDISNCISVIVY